MKKGQEYEGIVAKVAFPNKCIVAVEGEEKKVIVKNALEGQKVRFRLSKARKGKCEGNLLEVLEPSPVELQGADIPCEHFGSCGGCTYQHLGYEHQLALKETQIRELLSPVIAQAGGDFDQLFEGVMRSPRQFGYRNKMEFSFGDACKDGDLALGMHKRGSFYDIITVDHCQIVDADFRKILAATLDYFAEKNIPYLHKNSHEGYLRHLLVRKATRTGEILVDLVTTTQLQDADELLNGYVKILCELKLDGSLAGILHTHNDSVADIVKDEGTDILYGQSYFYEELLGLRFQISPFSFFQTNSLGAEVLYDVARSYVGDLREASPDGAVVYDLYSGTGTIAQILAPVAKQVIGVEIVEEAVEAAKENAALNGLMNCDFLAGDVLKVLDTIEKKPDFIVLDPPRDGIHPKALEKILSYDVGRMIYISCKPTSLARDLEVILARGYKVQRIACVDMFPGTVHVETVVLLSQLRQKPDDYIDVDVDVAELEGTSAETKATYEKIKKYVAEHNGGMKVSNLYIAQVKRKCGLELAENFNLPKSEDAIQPQCPKEKEEAIVEALKAFQMI